MAPRFTALLNSYVRLTYLWKSLESILIQSDAPEYEVVMISAIPGIQVPDHLQRLADSRAVPVRVVQTPPGPVGQGLHNGTEAARGEFVVVLDDDDLWEPCKLARLDQAIERVPDVGYLHNSQWFVDESDRPIFPWGPHQLFRHPSALMREGRQFTIDPGRSESIAAGQSFGPDFNNSSIAIRRSILAKYDAALRSVRRGEDTFLYYCALAAGRPLVLTSDRLTRYRLHGAASTAGVQPGFGPSSTERGYLDFVDGHVESLGLVGDQLVGTAPPGLTDWVSMDLEFWNALRDIALGTFPARGRRPRLQGLLSGRVRPRAREVYAAVWSVASSVSPVLTRTAFRAWRRVW